MTENKPPPDAGPSQGPTADDYKAEKAKLHNMLTQRNQILARLNALETGIAAKEAAYLESTPNGNIMTGFDNYIKGGTGAAAGRKKTVATEQNRLFTNSSISYRPSDGAATPGSAGSTPASHAPTPISTSFANHATGSNQPTPTSATASKASKKKRVEEDRDSEPDSRGAGNKKRATFGTSRK